MEIKYQLVYSKQVISKDIPKLSTSIKGLIKSAIEKKLLMDPIKFGKPLKYNFKGCRSFRVGDYRIIYQLVDISINILFIGHRKDCYDQE